MTTDGSTKAPKPPEDGPRFLAGDYQGSAKLAGRVALITGGGTGIGRAVAVLFAREGADVAIVYHHGEEDAQDTARWVGAEGRRCLLLGGDVKDPAFCRDAVDKTVATFGRLDVLVNNAAYQHRRERISDITDADFDETLHTNVHGYFHMAQAALAHMQPGASIINTGSLAGLDGNPDLLDYSATKGAIHAFTKALARNLAERRIRVNAVAPGPVWTPLNPTAGFEPGSVIKRAAQPEELSPAYVFLASNVCSNYMTGVVLPITGEVGAI